MLRTVNVTPNRCSAGAISRSSSSTRPSASSASWSSRAAPVRRPVRCRGLLHGCPQAHQVERADQQAVLDLADRGPRDRPGRGGSGSRAIWQASRSPGRGVTVSGRRDRTVGCRAVHFYATVFLPAMLPAEVATAIAAALAPYDCDDYTHGTFDPWATWDSWEPARAATAFPLRPRGLDRIRPGRRRVAFAAPKSAIDFAAMRDRAVRHAAGEFDAWAELSAAHPRTRP